MLTGVTRELTLDPLNKGRVVDRTKSALPGFEHSRVAEIVQHQIQKAIDLLPGIERAIGSERFAQYQDNLRKAGLP